MLDSITLDNQSKAHFHMKRVAQQNKGKLHAIITELDGKILIEK